MISETRRHTDEDEFGERGWIKSRKRSRNYLINIVYFQLDIILEETVEKKKKRKQNWKGRTNRKETDK